MQQPLVSIIIPVYNAENYLAQTIQSAIGQTWPNKEIIVVDDGSTDKSLAIAKKFKNHHITIIKQANKGASAARNTGFTHAKGEYIQFLDADDFLSLDKIAAQVKTLNGSFDKLALCGTVYFYDGTKTAGINPKSDWFAAGSKNPIDFLLKLYGGDLIGPTYGGMVQPNAWLTPRKIIEKAGLWNEDLFLDIDGEFFCRVILASKGISYSTHGANYYRKYKKANNLSASKSYKAMQSAINSNLLKLKHLTAKTNNPLVKKVMARYFMHNAFNCYPNYKDLSLQAHKIAQQLWPNIEVIFFKNPIKKFVSKIIGWRLLKQLEHLKN